MNSENDKNYPLSGTNPPLSFTNSQNSYQQDSQTKGQLPPNFASQFNSKNQDYPLNNQDDVPFDQSLSTEIKPNQVTSVHNSDIQGKRTLLIPILLDDYQHPTLFHCSYCNNQAISKIKFQPGSNTYACCCLLSCFTCILCPVPFLLPNCQDRFHFCPVCGAQVGYKQFKPC